MSKVVPEPKLNRTTRGVFRGRWRWWYASICDYRLSHPGCTNKEIAAFLRKSENTISAIANTDLYREYEAQRKQAWRARSEETLRAKLTSVTMLALDSAEAQLRKKGDQIPLAIAKDLLETGLDRLGFGPQAAPSVVVNNHQVLIPNAVSPAALEDARKTLRALEQKQLVLAAPTPDVDDVLDGYAVDVVSQAEPLEGAGTPLQEGETGGGPAHAPIIDS